jgi:cytochrome c-type biogenesis protein CcmF
MVAELGLFALILAFFAALHQGLFPMIGALRGDPALMGGARNSALILVVLLLFAFALLTIAFANSDFSVRTVAENSNTEKPFAYKLAGVWGNHEGSMLLWVLILALYGGAVAAAPGPMTTLRARALAVQGLIAAAFLAFIILASNPFARLFPTPVNGADLNPLLQDPGLVLHPPFLYLGYVGFSVAFAYAVAGLIGGKIDGAWAREARPFALSAWVFLTIGIGLGSWWAYYELGWGGFWAWDPVENASFMPWLAGTALIHSLRVTEARGAFRAWTAFLAILAFSLSLIGTFLVRSGILTSVHAFAVDPLRGQAILAILALTIGGAFTLFALRGPALKSEARFAAVSRESALLFNNVLLVAACAVVFFGTFYPLLVELQGGKISVLAPYFNVVFTPFALLILLIIAPGAALSWKKGKLRETVQRLWPAGLAAVAALALAAALYKPILLTALLAAAFGVFAIVGAVVDIAHRVDWRRPGRGARLAALPSRTIGMALAHIGLGFVTLGAVGAGAWKSETLAYVDKGQRIEIAGHRAELVDVTKGEGPNYVFERATFAVENQWKQARMISAERRFYPVRGMQTTEAGIATGPFGDLYFTIGEFKEGKGWAVRAWRHPLVFWLWFGIALTATGGVVALAPARRRAASGKAVPQAAPAE